MTFECVACKITLCVDFKEWSHLRILFCCLSSCGTELVSVSIQSHCKCNYGLEKKWHALFLKKANIPIKSSSNKFFFKKKHNFWRQYRLLSMNRSYLVGWWRKCACGKKHKYTGNNSSQLSANIASNCCHINT